MNKTLLISEIFPPRHGGSGRWFVELYKRLPREEYLIAAGQVAGSEETDKDLVPYLNIKRLPLSSTSWGIRSLTGLGFYWHSYRALAHLVKAERISAIHCGRCLPEGVMGLLLNLRFGLPFLCFVHGEDIQTATESRELSWLIRQVFRRASRLIANSRNTAALLTDNWQVGKDKVHVLHPGMDAERFVPAARDNDFLIQMGWGERRILLTVGRLQRRKGQDMMIKALHTILKSHPDTLYVVVGDGEQRDELKALTSELGLNTNVQFLTELSDEDMIKCYQQCTLFALPNRTDGNDIEGFGMVLAEAQACGKPVLAGDSGGTRETMLEGRTGIIADCTNPEALASAVSKLLGSEEALQGMGAAARKHVEAALDWRVHVEKAKVIFEDAG